MAMESSHGDTASIQLMAWEPSHSKTARDSSAHKRPVLGGLCKRPTLIHVSDRACGVAAKQRAAVGRQSEGGTAKCSVTEVLDSSGVMAMSPKNWMYENRPIC